MKAFSQEEPEIRSFAVVNRDVPRQGRRAREVERPAVAAHGLRPRRGGARDPVRRRPGRDRRASHDRAAGAVPRVPAAHLVADDRARRGRQHGPAGLGVTGPTAGGVQRASRHRRPHRRRRHADQGRGRDARRVVRLRADDRAARHLVLGAGGRLARDRRPDRLGQEHAGQPHPASLRCAAGRDPHRRDRREALPARRAATRRRLRPAGDVPLLGPAARERRLRHRPGAHARRSSNGRARCRSSGRTSRTSRRATTR